MTAPIRLPARSRTGRTYRRARRHPRLMPVGSRRPGRPLPNWVASRQPIADGVVVTPRRGSAAPLILGRRDHSRRRQRSRCVCGINRRTETGQIGSGSARYGGNARTTDMCNPYDPPARQSRGAVSRTDLWAHSVARLERRSTALWRCTAALSGSCGCRGSHRFERLRDDLGDVGHRLHRERVQHFGGYVIQIRLIAGRNENR